VNIDKRFVTKGYNSGGADYITKPFDPDLLLLKVKTFCRLFEQNRDLKVVHDALRQEIDSRKTAQQEVERMNSSLEEKVAQRTQELVQLNKDLEIRNAELAQYASLASHDLQEPLRKIITFSRMVEEKYLATVPDARRYIGKVIESSERMRNLIHDLLNYSKLSGQSHFSIISLNEAIENTLSDLEVAIDEKRAKIIVQALPDIEAIPGQVRQLFQNILSNALKFSKPGITPVIRIWSEYLKEKDIEAAASPEGDFIRVFIQDNGIGFDELYLSKIFTIFQRLHGQSEYAGTGIGLAIVKKIIEKHDGIIWARSKVEEGSTFIIVLPMRQIKHHFHKEYH
jgi:light-regulated signal transduction histidine kinase (bacteriophytochrome)